MLANHAPASNDSPQGDSDYETILTALMETARGRSFLREYALRTLTTDTASLLTAIGRIEDLLITRSLEPQESARDHAPASAIEFLGPQVIAAALRAEPAQPADPIKPAPREPFADICALSNAEKIALFA